MVGWESAQAEKSDPAGNMLVNARAPKTIGNCRSVRARFGLRSLMDTGPDHLLGSQTDRGPVAGVPASSAFHIEYVGLYMAKSLAVDYDITARLDQAYPKTGLVSDVSIYRVCPSGLQQRWLKIEDPEVKRGYRLLGLAVEVQPQFLVGQYFHIHERDLGRHFSGNLLPYRGSEATPKAARKILIPKTSPIVRRFFICVQTSSTKFSQGSSSLCLIMQADMLV